MDAKDSRPEPTLTKRSSDGAAKFALQYDRSKCHDAGANAFKGDAAGARPCAVIGPDRVVPPARDGPKKPPAEPWLAPDPVYRRLSDYPHKMSDHKDPTRNISPRQTFQENMQRIIMPPGYNAIKMHEDPSYASKNNKLNVPMEVKYCEVPYNINPINSDQKHIRNSDHSASNVNPLLMRGVPHGWPAGSVNVRPLRPYGAPEVLQYPDYANCPGPRPMLTRAHSSGQDELQQLYADPYYHENNVRFKPYPNIKERYPQARYEYIGNYPNPYHSPHSFAHKYELPKTIPPHTYSGFPPVPVKYPDRVSEPVPDGYQRAFTQQGNYPVPIRNPIIHPPYRPVPGSQMQNKLHPYPPDGHQHKGPVPNKLPYDPSSKMYLDYETRSKPLPMTDNYYLNELPRPYHAKNIVLPNYGPASMHGVNPHPYYIKEMPMKNYEYAHFKNMDPSMINHSLTKLPPQFSPSTLAISPADSNASNETAQTHCTSQEDCGYVSQSSVASVRSIESLNRIPMDVYGRYDYRYGPIIHTSSSSKPDPNSSQESKSKKDIRQFISSWSEGDEENTEGNAKRDAVKTIPDGKHNFSKQYEAANNQEQLYVLGLVNVPSEELSKYEHIQKVSKLPENIKGYNSLELLSQFEEAIESSNITNVKPPTPRTIQMPLKSIPHKQDPIPRAVSPLDVEAKISQSVIHKDVGCNFEIKPCSPKMLNVEVATPMQTLLNERVIEKVANPHNIKSPIVLQSMDESIDSTLINKTIKCPVPTTASSCKMINSQHLSESSAIDHLKTNYSLQDLESNSGVCLASLPRLDTDIELNFPEVNQQFINANKTDSVITASFTKDLPALDGDRTGTSLKNTEYDMNYQFSPKTETETDFSKLSKYRKLKRSVPDSNNTALAKAQASRVDSVIIKNPDNTRGHEENNDTSSSYYRKDFQEFAMNLVSQVKTSKVNLLNEADKMFSTSANNTSKYDEINIHSPSDYLIQKSSNVINKSLNEVEEPKNGIHVQSEDLSTQSKELSNRYVEKGALDIPMNLSPKAKCSSFGIGEEIKNNQSSNMDEISDVKSRFDVEHTCQNKNSEDTSADSLFETDNTVIGTQLKNLNDSTKGNIGEKPIIKLNNLDTCSSSDLSKESEDVRGDITFQNVPHIEKVIPFPITTSYNEEEIVFEKQIDELYLQENVEKSKKEGDLRSDIFSDDKEMCIDKISNINFIDSSQKRHDILSKMDRKKNDIKSHSSKLKRKKHKSEIKHRKRSTEKRSTTIFDEKSNNKLIDQNLKKSLNSEIPDSVKQSINEEKPNMTGSIQSEGPDKTELIRSECPGNVKDCPELVKDNITLPCLPREDKGYKLIQKSQREVTETRLSMDIDNLIVEDDTRQDILSTTTDLHLDDPFISRNKHPNDASGNSLPMDIDNVGIKDNNKYIIQAQEMISATTDVQLDNPFVSSNSPKSSIADRILPFDQHESEEKPSQVYTCNDFKEKDASPTTVSDEHKLICKDNVINPSLACERKEFCDPIISNEEDKERINELLNISIHRETEELDTPVHIAQNKKEAEDRQTRDELERVSFKNKDDDLDIATHRSEDKFLKVCSQPNAKVFSEEKTPHHPHINKELFSPRFQHLIILNENYDICYGVNESKITDVKSTVLNPGANPVVQDQRICTIRQMGITADTVPHLNKTIVDSNVILNPPNTVDPTDTLPQAITEEKPDESLHSKFTEMFRNNLNDDYLREGDSKMHVEEKEKTVLDTQLNLKELNQENGDYVGSEPFDEREEAVTDTYTKSVEDIVGKSPGDVVLEGDTNSEYNDDHELITGSVISEPFNEGEAITETCIKSGCDTNSEYNDNELITRSVFSEPFNRKEEATTETGKRSVEDLVKSAADVVPKYYTNSENNDDHEIITGIVVSEPLNEDGGAITEPCIKSVEEVIVKSPGEDVIPEVDTNSVNNDDHELITRSVVCEPFNEEEAITDTQLNNQENVDYAGSEPFDEREEAVTDKYTKSAETVGIKSPREDDVPEGETNLESNDDHALITGSTVDNIETDTCETNFIVIEETANVTSGPDVEYDPSNINKKIQSFTRNLSARPRYSLKRSLSDSALNAFDDNADDSEKRCLMLPKRKKVTDISNIDESHLLNIIQSSRRNSISTLCNENFSFCILIDDNCIVAGDNYEQENEFIEFDNVALNPALKESVEGDERCPSPAFDPTERNENDSYISKCDEEKSWVDDVGCEETIETEDIAENIVIGEPASPKDSDISDYESDDENIGVLNNDVVDHTSKVKHIYGDNMCTNDAQLVDALYRTPQMDVNRRLMDRESQVTDRNTKYYDSDSLEMMLSEPVNNIPHVPTDSDINFDSLIVQESNIHRENKDSKCLEVFPYLVSNLLTNVEVPNRENIETIKDLPESVVSDKARDEKLHSCESSLDNVFSYIHKDSSYTSSSSPEVSSTTSEEKNSSILLKISNFKGSRTSEVKQYTQKENSCKFTEKEYMNPNYNNGTSTNRPLLTKGAQKYIPPLKETIPDLKVKLALPKQSLLKLQKNKVAKEEPKLIAGSSTYSNTSNFKPRKEIPKKIKPKFEDVLKNIDKVQFQKHKEKNKKTKKYIPKVVIKKSENGSHYASTSSKDAFNPDLTGRKWQPWVFIEKNQFIDKMALRNKTRAVFSHRRKSFVLAEKICRYKSISSAKFIISQPKINDFSAGNLKYTIKLKHTY